MTSCARTAVPSIADRNPCLSGNVDLAHGYMCMRTAPHFPGGRGGGWWQYGYTEDCKSLCAIEGNNMDDDRILKSLQRMEGLLYHLSGDVRQQLKFIGSLLFINTGLVGVIIYMAFWR